LAVSGYEADDILASLIEDYKAESDLSLCLYSGDKDLKQVLDKNVCIMDPVKDVPYQVADFVKEF
jgi:5'-3' exonuclease